MLVCLLIVLLFYSSLHMHLPPLTIHHLRCRCYTLKTVPKSELRTTSACLLTPSPYHHLPSCHRCITTYTLNTDSTSSLNSSIMASVAVRPSVYPHGFCFHSYHHQSSYQDHAPFLPQPQPVVAKPPPTDPYYGHEETTKYVLGL